MKKTFYIVAFMFLGLLVSFLIHAALEIPILSVISRSYEVYGKSFLWQHWSLIHGLGGALLALSGLVMGFFLGRKWWQILYVEKRYGTPRW